MTAGEFYAHSLDGARPAKWQLLRDHLEGAARLARKSAEAARPNDVVLADAAYWAGLLHDLGKYRDEFQQYLRNERRASHETVHAVYGAAPACFQYNCSPLAFAVASHHTGLYDAAELTALVEGSRYEARSRYGDLLALLTEEVGPNPALVLNDTQVAPERMREYELTTRMLFSMLVDADRLDSEAWDMSNRLGSAWQRTTHRLDVTLLLGKLLSVRTRKARERTSEELNALRNVIFDTCLEQGQSSPQGFFSLTVPTGGGKTLSSMAFALAHAQRHNLRRVIVVIPYLSIIEQNAHEYHGVFGADYVLEHHSAVEAGPAVGNGDHAGKSDPPQASAAEKAMENWDAPIVVTTSVQFIETLFASRASKVRKLHNIARSIVIFDEVQTMPTHLLNPTLDMLRELKAGYGVSFLFCSATQPAFRKAPNVSHGFAENEILEIAPDPRRLAKSLCRVSYQVMPSSNKWNWQKLAERMLAHDQVLCVLNLRKHAFSAWQTVRDRIAECDLDTEGLFHLSSAMCPAHRLDLLGLSNAPPINNIKRRLKEGRPCWVISTQLVEAGVDVDFPVVFRAMGPLDSIVQAAGRCNREGLLRDEHGQSHMGEVIVFHPDDEGLPQGIYQRATAITPHYLEDIERLTSDPVVFAEYFNELYQLSSTDHNRRGEHTIQEDRERFNFRRVAEHARVIKDDTVAVIAPYGPAIALIAAIRRERVFDHTTLRRLQRYMVNVRHCTNQHFPSDYDKLLQCGALTPLLAGRLEIPVLDKAFYKGDLGLVIENRALEDFIV